MKVIFVKKYKQWNENDIIEFNDGFAKNFLLKNNYAISYNKQNAQIVEKAKKILFKKQEENNRKLFIEKQKLENIELLFHLNINNGKSIGSISKKTILFELQKQNIKIDKHILDNVNIKTIGIHNLNLKLSKNIVAILRIRVEGKNEK